MAKGSNTVKETEEERALAQIAAEKYRTFKDLYDPQIDNYIDKVRMDQNDYSFGRAEVGTALGLQQRQNEREAISRGLNPNRSSMAFLDSVAGPASAMNEASSFLNIDKEIDSIHYRGLESVAKLGQGISQGAQRGITDIAEQTSDMARHNAMQDFEYRSGNQRAIGKLAGWGADAYESGKFDGWFKNNMDPKSYVDYNARFDDGTRNA